MSKERFYTKVEAAIVTKACIEYADIDMSIIDCLERFFIDDCKFNENIAYDLASELDAHYIKNNY